MAGLVLAAACALAAAPARAAWAPEGVDLTRPRLLRFPDGVAALQARLDREPYATIVRDLDRRARQANGVALDDHTVEAGRIKARAAKNLAFLYAIDRQVVGGVAVPFASAEEKAAAGERVRALLVNLFDRSRLAVPPPLGDWDRDISTSEELLQYATAYDTMLGAGYDFGADDAVIRERITNVASELYLNYIDPDSAGNAASLHQNNHRSKTGASLAAAGVALAEQSADPATDPAGLREPANWIGYGLDQVDLVLRWVLVAADGAYGEGPFYYRFTLQNLLPFLRAWDDLVGGATVEANGVLVPSLWRHPSFRSALRWAVDTTLPDGSLAAFDDGNVLRTHYYGVFPQDHPWADAFAWHWQTGAQPFETDGNVDLAADALVHYDDGVVSPAPRAGSPTAFYPEGGNAIFRSGWGREAVVAVVNAEGDVASEFGRDRDGLGVHPQSHEHLEPGSFLLHGFGERLAIDPGYFTFPTRYLVNKPEHHNVVLVDGVGPREFLAGSFLWPLAGLANRPDADGLASLAHELDGDFLDAARSVTRYGGGFGVPIETVPRIERRFLFGDDRYLVLADAVDDPAGAPRAVRVLLHGNGGGTSGGAFEATATGGRWTIGAARLDGAVAFDAGAPAFTTGEQVHEAAGRTERTHVVLGAEASGIGVRGVAIVYPGPSAGAPPAIADLALAGAAGLALTDTAADRRLVAAHRAHGGAAWSLPAARAAESDGSLALFDARLDGSLRLAFAEPATRLAYDGAVLLETIAPGSIGVRLEAERAEIVADTADPWLRLPALPFTPAAADGACALAERDGAWWVQLGRERRVVVRAAAGNAAPAADPGAGRSASLGETLTLDARASCDADGDALVPRWELVAAPPGSDWLLDDPASWTPALTLDRAGPYRVRLVVRDAHGAESRSRDLVIHAGPRCANLVDEDLDGLIDSDDPDCDDPPDANRPPVATADAYEAASGALFEPAEGVLANDADADPGDARVAVLVEPPAGALWLRPDGTFAYEPPPAFAGTDRFTYRARDAAGAESAPAEVTIGVGAAPRDAVGLFLYGTPLATTVPWTELASGDVEVARDAAGVSAVSGGGALAGSDLVVAFALARGAGGAWHGTVSIADTRLGAPPLVVPIDGPLVFPYSGDAGVLGWSGFANPGLPPGAGLVFTVDDRD